MARLDRGPVSGAACGPDMPAIEVRSLSFAYPDTDAAVLEGLDWSVPQGAFALLVGGTGSGKSTLLSLLKPEIAPAGERTGDARVLGENVADMDVRASAERVGYVFQDPENQIVCETVWHEMAFGLENLGMSRDEMRRRVAETSYFFGLEDWLHRDTDTLSGGRKQLLSLAAVLALRPPRLSQVPQRLAAVRAFASLPEALAHAAANKRITNILKKAGPVDAHVNPELLLEQAEKDLFIALQRYVPESTAQFEAGDYTASLQTLAILRAPVDAFFDGVMVNADDVALKNNFGFGGTNGSLIFRRFS